MSAVPVSVAELQAAWREVEAGAFRGLGVCSSSGHEPAAAERDLEPGTRARAGTTQSVASNPAAGSLGVGVGLASAILWADREGAQANGKAAARWTPGPGERVVPVLGCGGAAGASCVALGLGELLADRLGSVRLVECGSPSVTGLGRASTAELGIDPASGWVQARRGRLMLERGNDTVLGPALLAHPAAGHRPDHRDGGQQSANGADLVSVLDVGWDLAALTASPVAPWLLSTVVEATDLVVVTVASVRGMLRLESVLTELAECQRGHDSSLGPTPPASVCVAVVGPRPRKWAPEVSATVGPRTAALFDRDRIHPVPEDPDLAVLGLSADPLPARVTRSLIPLSEQLARSLSEATIHDPAAPVQARHRQAATDVSPTGGAEPLEPIRAVGAVDDEPSAPSIFEELELS